MGGGHGGGIVAEVGDSGKAKSELGFAFLGPDGTMEFLSTELASSA
jgi:hypothetical protein